MPFKGHEVHYHHRSAQSSKDMNRDLHSLASWLCSIAALSVLHFFLSIICINGGKNKE